MPKQTLVFENPVQQSVQNSLLKITYKDDPENITKIPNEFHWE